MGAETKINQESALHLENVTMQFGGVVSVNNLTLDVPKGQIIALIGPNGAGKTTAFNCITGVYQPTNGLISFMGKPMVRTYPRGKDAKIYKVIKFKTMTDERDAEGNLLPDAQRLTKVGKVVRSLSIDELPQLINILKGDMAFIGPRPWKVEYLPLYSPEQMRRHEVRPGISGWAQVHGRNAISFTKRLEYDVYYVDHLTFGLDVKIFFMTILKVFKREGISEEGQATSEPFNGYN